MNTKTLYKRTFDKPEPREIFTGSVDECNREILRLTGLLEFPNDTQHIEIFDNSAYVYDPLNGGLYCQYYYQ